LLTLNLFIFQAFLFLPQASDAYHFFTSGQAKIQQGLIKEGYDLICEALNLLNNVYGAMHPEIAACLRLLARLNYIMGDYGEVCCKEIGGNCSGVAKRIGDIGLN